MPQRSKTTKLTAIEKGIKETMPIAKKALSEFSISPSAISKVRLKPTVNNTASVVVCLAIRKERKSTIPGTNTI
jgi:hypothetical protein